MSNCKHMATHVAYIKKGSRMITAIVCTHCGVIVRSGT